MPNLKTCLLLACCAIGLPALVCAANPPFRDVGYGGSPDGIATLRSSTSEVYVRGGLATADGRLLVSAYGGGGWPGPHYPALIRLTADGRSDTSFGANHDGQSWFDLPNAYLYEPTLSPSGSIFLSGGFGPSGLVANLTQAGVPNRQFDQDGLLYVGGNAFIAGGTAAAFSDTTLQSDGKLIAAGIAVVEQPAQSCTAVMRIDAATGAWDPSFGNGTGRVCVAPQNGTPLPQSVGLSVVSLADGRILVAGQSLHTGSSGYDFSIVRLTSAGQVDTTFGPAHDGWTFAAFDVGGNLDDAATSMAVDAAGRIVVVGSVDPYETGIARFSRDGIPDTTFGLQGRVTVASLQNPHLMTTFADGHLLLGGGISGQNGAPGLALMLRADGTPEPRFGDHGRYEIPGIFRGSAAAGDYAYLIGEGSGQSALVVARTVLPLFFAGFESTP